MARLAEQHFLGDRGHVDAVLIEDVTDRQAAGAGEMVTRKVVKMPSIGAHWSVKPNRVIETDAGQMGIRVAVIHRLMSRPHRVAGEIIRHIRQPALMEKRFISLDRFRHGVGDPHPGGDSPRAIASRAPDMVVFDEAPIEVRGERRVVDTVGRRHDRERHRLQHR